MPVPREVLDRYTAGMRDIKDRGHQAIQQGLRSIDYTASYDTIRDNVNAVMDAACGTAAQSGATMSAGLYDGLRERAVGERLGATATSNRKPEATEASVRAFLEQLYDGDYDAFERLCMDRLDYETNRAAGECVMENARRDPHNVRYARVPQGRETCEWCLMLASRGPVYHTEESAGAFDHYHAHCDCAVVPFFDTWALYGEDGHFIGRRADYSIEGYSPDELYQRYLDRMLDTSLPTSQRPGYQPSGGDRTHAAQWGRAYNEGLVTMGSIGEVSHAIRNAETYQELFDLIQLINRELEYYGASAEVIQAWQSDLIEARNRLIAEGK